MNLTKMSRFDVLFGQKQWARRISQGFWVKMMEAGYSWIKWDKEKFNQMNFVKGTSFLIEDYSGCKFFKKTKVITREFLKDGECYDSHS